MSDAVPNSSSTTLTLFEHETSTAECSIGDQRALERLERVYEQPVLRSVLSGNRLVLQATQFVGVVHLGTRTIQVLPKIYRADVALSLHSQQTEAMARLLSLLSYTEYMPPLSHDALQLQDRPANWFEILTRIFAQRLLGEWKRGAARRYQLVQDELPVLKGKLRIGEMVRRPVNLHQFHVSYDEFTVDNAINRIFRHVVNVLWRITHDGTNRRLLGELRAMMEDVASSGSVTLEDVDAVTIDRTTARYGPLLNMARLFIGHRVTDLSPGASSQFAFVLDMNRVFESFMAGFIGRHRQVLLPAALAECSILPQAKSDARHLARTDNRPVFLLRPDIVLTQAGHYPLLIDTKYKVLKPLERALGIGQDDFYQMCAYARRYVCPRVLLLYPQTATMPEPLYRRFQLEETSEVIEAATLNLTRDVGTPSGRAELCCELRSLLERGESYDRTT